MRLTKRIIGVFLLGTLFFSFGQQKNKVSEGQYAWQDFSKDQ